VFRRVSEIEASQAKISSHHFCIKNLKSNFAAGVELTAKAQDGAKKFNTARVFVLGGPLLLGS
jgi:hypothetical protein